MTWRIQGPAWVNTLALALALVLTACGTDNEKHSIAGAKLALDKGDLKAASILIKNALQENPESAQARFLFGKLLLETGDVRAAEIELRKAQQGHQPIEDAAPLLAGSLYAQRQYQKVIGEYASLRLTDAKLHADLSAIVAAAYVSTGQRDRATALVDSVLLLSPDHEKLQLLQATLFAGQRDIDGALKIIGLVIDRSAQSVEAWRLQGDMLWYGKGDRPAAQAAYRKVLEIRPDDHGAHTKLIGIHIADNDLKLASQQYAALVKVHPNHPLTLFQGANISFLRGDFIRAREQLAQLMKAGKDNPSQLLLAAATELQLNSLVQAENHLNKVLSIVPGSPAARRLMATVHLRTGQTPKALDVLRPLLDSATPDAEALTLAAEAHIQSGDPKKAAAFFARVAKLKPDDVKARTAIALTQLATGETDLAMNALRSIAASDTGTLADLALINARLRQRDLEGALRAIDLLDRKLPDKPLPSDLRGRALLLKRDNVNARASFEKALSLDPVYYPAVATLALMDRADNKPEAAKSRLEAVLKADPNHVRALVAMAGLRSAMGGSAEEVSQLLSRAIEANPSEPGARVILVEHWLKQGNAKQALSAAQSGLAAIPDEPSLLDTLGRAQLANDEVGQALNTLGKLAARQPKSAFVHLRMAEIHLRAKNSVAAEQSLRRALEISPE